MLKRYQIRKPVTPSPLLPATINQAHRRSERGKTGGGGQRHIFEGYLSLDRALGFAQFDDGIVLGVGMARHD